MQDSQDAHSDSDREGRDCADAQDASRRALTDPDFWAVVLALLVCCSLLA